MPDPRALFILSALALFVLAGKVGALDFDLPGEAVLMREETSPADTYFLPVAPFADGRLPTRKVEGQVIRQAWRIDGGRVATTLQLVSPLRDQLEAAGFEIILDCEAQECGGFDFRFNTTVLPAPDMFVDLFDFRFVSARKQDGDGVDYISCLVSLAGGAGYVQLVAVGAIAPPRIETAVPPMPSSAKTTTTATPPPGGRFVERLVANGHVVLNDLEFGSGSAALAEGGYTSLAALAGFLGTDASRRIALVGHTDAVGGLDANLALSHERAAAALERLVERHGVPREQIEAEGVGYLSPIAPNTTRAGREANRRVEAVLLNAGQDR